MKHTEPSEGSIMKLGNDIIDKTHKGHRSQTPLNQPLVRLPRPLCKSRAYKNPNRKWINTLPLPAKEKWARCLRKKHTPASSIHLWARIRKSNTVCLEIIDIFFGFSGYGEPNLQCRSSIHPLFLFNNVPQNENIRFPFSNSWLLSSESWLVWFLENPVCGHFSSSPGLSDALPWILFHQYWHQIPSASNKHAMECST